MNYTGKVTFNNDPSDYMKVGPFSADSRKEAYAVAIKILQQRGVYELCDKKSLIVEVQPKVMIRQEVYEEDY